jgi:exopolyphosphatase/guanosine-5'-triphosphate,3'-diphosphate pyrophosphatase
LVLDIGGGSTEVATAVGERPVNLWSVALGAVRLAQLFGVNGRISEKNLAVMRGYAEEAVAEALPRFILGAPRRALGSSGNIRAVVSFAAAEGTAHATVRQLSRAVEELVRMGQEGRRRVFDPNRADIVVPGAVILEALARHLKLESVTAVDRGLRDGLLVDLMRRRSPAASDRWLVDAALEFGRRCQFDEAHASQVARNSLKLFDQLARVHKLPSSYRHRLEVAALLHDVGNLVSYPRHHRHTYYLIQNADIPGMADRERELVAHIARYHRRNLPDLNHEAFKDLTRTEAVSVRKLAALLRVGDALDRSHHQVVRSINATVRGSTVVVTLDARAPVDLELWDVESELKTFREVFGKKPQVVLKRR